MQWHEANEIKWKCDDMKYMKCNDKRSANKWYLNEHKTSWNDMEWKWKVRKWNETQIKWNEIEKRNGNEKTMTWWDYENDNGNRHEPDMTQWLGELVTACLNGCNQILLRCTTHSLSQDFSIFGKEIRCIARRQTYWVTHAQTAVFAKPFAELKYKLLQIKTYNLIWWLSMTK